jgi:hypothetical protein
MGNPQEESKKGREVVYERVWAAEENEDPPDINEIIKDVREAHKAAFQSPGRLTIRGARKHC